MRVPEKPVTTAPAGVTTTQHSPASSSPNLIFVILVILIALVLGYLVGRVL